MSGGSWNHGSPYDRGSADKFYGRPPQPHKWLDEMGRQRVELTDPKEIDEYNRGFDEETERKEW